MDARFTRWTRFVVFALMALGSGTLYISTAASDNLEVKELYRAESTAMPTLTAAHPMSQLRVRAFLMKNSTIAC